jgi:hypothetical protein
LASEYVKAGIESLEYDLGVEATYIIKKEHREAFASKYAELEAEERPLAEEVEGKQKARREILSARLKKASVQFGVAVGVFALSVILTIIFAIKIPTVMDNRYIPWTIGFGVLSVVAFAVFVAFFSKFFNVCKIYNKNEKVSSTEGGKRLVEIRAYKALYGALLEEAQAEETSEE